MERVVDEKVKKVLEAIDVENVDNLTRSKCIRALGRLLAVKVRGAKPSTYEVTKEVRRALRLLLRSPLGKNVENVIESAIFMDAPFDSPTLNATYRLLLERLLTATLDEIKELTPMWRIRLLNLMIENIYNVTTTEGRSYIGKILETLKESDVG
ncbi:MAG: hypothetical protein QXP86_03495 [Nitrososphaerota archaeon]